MIAFRKLISTLFSSFLIFSVSAQFVVEPTAGVTVFNAVGQPLHFPWTGGLNAVDVSTFDADFDGQNDDLYIYDKAGNRSLVFLGDMVDGERRYTYSVELSRSFPPLQSWALLRDYDCDGRKDLFTYSTLGGAIAVYRNVGSASGLAWELAEEVLMSYYDFGTTNYTTNIYCSSQDVPAIFDYDGDGDLDIITANVGGTFLEFHFNQSIESGLGCGLQKFELANRCYGGFLEGQESNDIILDPAIVAQSCTFNVVNPKSNDGGGASPKDGLRHVGATILAADFNDDGLIDLVLGDAGYSNLVYLENSDGDGGTDQIVFFDMDFPSTFGVPGIELDQFVSSYYEDVTGDGIPDLLASVNQSQGAANYNSLYMYENLGTETAPIFSSPVRNFLQNQTLDYGERSAPAVFDYNGDGLDDLLIAARGAYDNGVYVPLLTVLENVGTANEPAFQVADTDWLSIADHGIFSPKPTFGDLSGDGLSELLIGAENGTVHRFDNIGTPQQPEWLHVGLVFADNNSIIVGSHASPQLFDLDGDGLLDLIVGNLTGKVSYYRNTGTAIFPAFTLITDVLGGVSTVESPPFFTGYSHPHLYNFEGETYMVCGSKSGNLFLYGNIDGNLDGNFDLLTKQAYGAYPPALSVPAGRHSTPFVYDWNGDGFPDLLVGGVGGGLEYFVGYDPDLIRIPSRSTTVSLSPNPTDGTLNITLSDDNKSPRSIEIVSVMGAVVSSKPYGSGIFDFSELSDGVYVLSVKFGDGSSSQAKFVVSH